jgi:hypothetical protein
LAEAELIDRAETVARSIPNSRHLTGVMVEKATALIAIAGKLTAQGKLDQAPVSFERG